MIFARPLPGYDDGPILRALPPVQAGPPLTFRAEDDGFVVEELPAYLPQGSGEHLYLFIEKRGVSTPAVVARLRERYGLDEREIGYAGRKDERGITRQWLSVPARRMPEAVELGDGVRVIEAKRHGNKLRLGHLYGNRFTVHLDARDRDLTALRERAHLVSRGVPNVFGAQRFGPGDATLRQGEAFLSRSRPARSRRDEFLVSAVQSALFNAWLADRVDDGTWNTPRDGDVMMKVPTGAPFVCTAPDVDKPRVEAGEISVAGPLVGRAMRPAERDAMTTESRSWARLDVHIEELLAHPAFQIGARRAACVRPSDLALDVEGEVLSLRFSLPKGAYASVILRAVFGAALVDAAFVDHALPHGPD